MLNLSPPENLAARMAVRVATL